jgi:hypothetical protein
MADLPDARVTALTSMALQATTSGAPREAVDLISVARSRAGQHGSPVLLSLLAAREAVALAQMRDSTAAKKAIGSARNHLDCGGRGDGEPLWLEFWNPADLACHETRVALSLGDARQAERSARTALASSDATLFPRNHMIYALRLGNVLTRLGQLDESVSVIGGAIQNTQALDGSRRIAADLASTLTLLGRTSHPPAQRFAQAACKLVPLPT